MNQNELTALLYRSESETLDFKRKQYPFAGATDEEKGELLKDIVAMANAWKDSDAFIVVGIEEENGRAKQVCGADTTLGDADVQQFVNSKTNRPVSFRLEVLPHQGGTLTIIRIGRNQARPIFLLKPFGKLRNKVAYVRRGSSTDEATPDEIVNMDREDNPAHNVTLDLDWADGKNAQRLGKEANIECLNLVDPPPPPKPSPAEMLTNLPRVMNALQEFDKVANILKNLELPQGHPEIPDFSVNQGPLAEDLCDYVKARAGFEPLRFWLKNLGSQNAASTKVRIAIPELEGVEIVEESGLPQRPEHRMFPRIPFNSPFAPHVSVERGSKGWEIEVHAKTIQPQDEFWSEPIYVRCVTDRTIEAVAKIFADDLANPIEVTLKIHAWALTREITLDDLKAEWEP